MSQRDAKELFEEEISRGQETERELFELVRRRDPDWRSIPASRAA